MEHLDPDKAKQEVFFKTGIEPRDFSKPKPRFRDWAKKNLKIANKEGILVFFDLNEIQLEIDDEWELEEATIGYVRIIILKARQMGASAYIQARLFFQVWSTPNYKAGVMAHDIPGCDFVFERTQTFNEELPDDLKKEQKYGNRREIAFKAPHRSSMRTNVAKGRGGFGRGGTIHGVHMSEVAFWKKIRGQSAAQGQANAIKNSVPRVRGSVIVLESTANGMGGEFYDFYMKAKQRKNEFKALFFAWYKFKEYRLPGKKPDDYYAEAEWLVDEPALRDLGVDDEQLAWRRFMIADACDGDIDAFHQEYPSTDEEAFLTSGRPVFLASVVNKRMSELRAKYEGVRDQATKKWVRIPEPPRTLSFDFFWNLNLNSKGEFQQYKTKNGRPSDYVIIVDVAEGIERRPEEKQGDYSVIDVFDRRNNEQVAQWRGHVDPDKLGDLVYHVGKLYGNPIAVVESNNHGRVTIKRLQNLRYERIFFYQKIADSKRMSEVTYTKYGWETNNKTKPFSIACLQRLWRNRDIIINSLETCSEHLTYVRKENGATEAQSGRYDDTVMTCAIFAAWVEYHPHDRIIVEEEQRSSPLEVSVVSGREVLAALGVDENDGWNTCKTWGRRL